MSGRKKIKLYAIAITPEEIFIRTGNVEGVVVTEEGEPIATHISSSYQWLMHDLGVVEDGFRRDQYDQRFGKGEWEIIWCESIDKVPAEVIKKNKEGKWKDKL